MKEYSIAPIYDITLYPFVRGVRRGILSICLEEQFGTILDVCCGTGDQLKLLRKHGFDVAGVDLSREMLEVSKKGEFAPTCHLQDASDMSFEDESFDLAMTTFALHEKRGDTARAIVEEMMRVVKPEGRILLADYRFDEKTSPPAKGIITFFERIAGGEHYQNFLRYTESGGMDNLTEGLPLRFVREVRVGLGSVGICLYALNT